MIRQTDASLWIYDANGAVLAKLVGTALDRYLSRKRWFSQSSLVAVIDLTLASIFG